MAQTMIMALKVVREQARSYQHSAFSFSTILLCFGERQGSIPSEFRHPYRRLHHFSDRQDRPSSRTRRPVTASGRPVTSHSGTRTAGIECCHPTRVCRRRRYLDFLASLPEPEEIVALRPSKVLEDRVRDLLEKNRTVGLTADEQREWEQYEYLEHLVRRAKARAYLKLKGA